MVKRIIAPIGKTEKKREHYLPQRFLKGFTEEGRFAVAINRSGEIGRVLPNQDPANYGVMNRLYETVAGGAPDNPAYLFPNAVENDLSEYEADLFARLEKSLQRLASPLGTPPIVNVEKNPIRANIAEAVAHLITRSPLSVEEARKRSGIWLSAMRSSDLGTSESLARLYEEEVDEPLDSGSALDPERIAEHAAVSFTVAPFGLSRELFRHSELNILLQDIFSCSFILSVAPEGFPFVGISFPIFFGRGTSSIPFDFLFYPLSSRLALTCLNDGKGGFKRFFLEKDSIISMNREMLSTKEWDFAFCSSHKMLSALLDDLCSEGKSAVR